MSRLEILNKLHQMHYSTIIVYQQKYGVDFLNMSAIDFKVWIEVLNEFNKRSVD